MSFRACAAIAALLLATALPNEPAAHPSPARDPVRPPADDLCAPPAPGAAIADPAVAIPVRLHDPHGLLPGPVLKHLRKETREAFRRIGAAVVFAAAAEPPAVPATFYPEIPRHWKVGRHALGVAIGGPNEPRSVFLSVGAAKRTLDRRGARRRHWPERGPWAARLGRALGRILAHELLHAVAPDLPHSRHGLMAPRLTRRMLLAPGVGFDETVKRRLHRTAGEFGRCRRR